MPMLSMLPEASEEADEGPQTIHFSSALQATAQQSRASTSPAQSPRAAGTVSNEKRVSMAVAATLPKDESEEGFDGHEPNSPLETAAITADDVDARESIAEAGSIDHAATWMRTSASKNVWSKARHTINERTDRCGHSVVLLHS